MVGRNSSIVKRFQRKFRERRFSKVLQIIERQLEGKEQLRILDAGGLVGYWRMLPEHLRDRVRITIINRDHIVEDDRSVDADGLNIELCAGDACDMPQYADGSFDIVHSNSVIEHVGGYRQMMQFSAEVRRVGVALVDRLVRAADADGLWTLQASIFPENVASIRLHRSAGFRTVGVRERIARMDGEWRDTVLLERRR